MANGKVLAQGIFQGKVLAKLESIERKQDFHDEIFKDVYKRINENEKSIDTACGFAKGALIVGGLGAGGGILSWFTRLIR